MTPSNRKYDYDIDKINQLLRQVKENGRRFSHRDVAKEIGCSHTALMGLLDREIKNGDLRKDFKPELTQYHRMKK